LTPLRRDLDETSLLAIWMLALSSPKSDASKVLKLINDEPVVLTRAVLTLELCAASPPVALVGADRGITEFEEATAGGVGCRKKKSEREDRGPRMRAPKTSGA